MKKIQKLNELYAVKSSNIAKVGYDNGDAYVEFVNGNIYKYPNINKQIVDQLVKSESVGKTFSQTLKKADKFEKLENIHLMVDETGEAAEEHSVKLTLEYNGKKYETDKKFTKAFLNIIERDKFLNDILPREAINGLKVLLVRMQAMELDKTNEVEVNEDQRKI